MVEYNSSAGEYAELIKAKNAYRYERCALLIVDFNQTVPKLYESSVEFLAAGLISDTFGLEYEDISFGGFAEDILRIYAQRFESDNIMVKP